MSPSGTERMAYVAVDPEQPGSAWAAHLDDPSFGPDIKKSMAKEIASWVRAGATVMRVPADQAREMLMRGIEEKQPSLF